MTTKVWRWVITLVGVCSLLLVGLELSSGFASGDAGIIWVDGVSPFVIRIAVVPGGPAQRAGMQNGDLIILRAMPVRSRVSFEFSGLRFQEPLYVVVRRGARTLHFTVVPVRHAQPWYWFVSGAGLLWTAAWGLVVGLRRPDNPEARLLALMLCGFAWANCNPHNLHSPWLRLDFLLVTFAAVPMAATPALAAAYAARFGRPISMARRIVTRITYVALVYVALYQLVAMVGIFTGTVAVWADTLTAEIAQALDGLAPLMLPLVCAILAFRAAHPSERTRLTWALGPLVVSYGVSAVGTVAYALSLPIAGLRQIDVIVDLCSFVVPLGMTYSVLSRRVLDIGFALNRAAMFTATTLLLAGVFAGAQWLADTVLSGISARNPYLQLGIAVFVYYVVRISRTRTENMVSRLFFAARLRRIDAIHTLARSVDEVLTVEALDAFVVDSLRAQLAIEACVLLDDGSGHFVVAAGTAAPGRLSADDSLLIRLRAVQTHLPTSDGAIAVPMLVRRRLRGVLFCRAPERESEFAPDEINALEQLALRMTIAREDLMAEALRQLVGRPASAHA